jgi:nucleotide-binding universal stress UspA family protein
MTNNTNAGIPENQHVKVILAPTEGSDSEREALSVAVKLARIQGAVVHLVRIEPTPYLIEPAGKARTYDSNRAALEDRKVSRDELEVLAAACRATAHIQVISSFEKGPVGRTLWDYARKSGADLIVMASHSHGGRKRIALGSVTEYLIRRTNIPVLVVKGRASFIGPTEAETFATIVIPLDGSELSEAILPAATKLALLLKAKVNLVHVLTREATVNDYLGRVAGELAAEGISVTTDVLLSDDITAALLDYSARAKAGVIAIATSGAGGMSRFVFGSVADELTRRSPISLFAFHPVDQKQEARGAAQSRARAEAHV